LGNWDTYLAWPGGLNTAGMLDDENRGPGAGWARRSSPGAAWQNPAGRKPFNMVLAVVAVRHVDGSVDDDQDPGPQLTSQGQGWSVQCSRTVASSISPMSIAARGRCAL